MVIWSIGGGGTAACPVFENPGGWLHSMVDGVQGSAERTDAAVVAVSVQSCHWG